MQQHNKQKQRRLAVAEKSKLDLIRIDAKDWIEAFSENAHLAVFGEIKPKELDRIDFALLAIKDDRPVSYMTCREFDKESIYWQYGGTVDSFKDTIWSFKSYTMFTEWHKKHYKRALTYIENDNTVMLKMAQKVGFRIIGVRNFKGSVLLEHLNEFGG